MTWYCYQKKEEGKTMEIRLEIEGVATKEQQAQMRQMMKDGYKLIDRVELGNVSKCKG